MRWEAGQQEKREKKGENCWSKEYVDALRGWPTRKGEKKDGNYLKGEKKGGNYPNTPVFLTRSTVFLNRSLVSSVGWLVLLPEMVGWFVTRGGGTVGFSMPYLAWRGSDLAFFSSSLSCALVCTTATKRPATLSLRIQFNNNKGTHSFSPLQLPVAVDWLPFYIDFRSPFLPLPFLPLVKFTLHFHPHFFHSCWLLICRFSFSSIDRALDRKCWLQQRSCSRSASIQTKSLFAAAVNGQRKKIKKLRLNPIPMSATLLLAVKELTFPSSQNLLEKS